MFPTASLDPDDFFDEFEKLQKCWEEVSLSKQPYIKNPDFLLLSQDFFMKYTCEIVSKIEMLLETIRISKVGVFISGLMEDNGVGVTGSGVRGIAEVQGAGVSTPEKINITKNDEKYISSKISNIKKDKGGTVTKKGPGSPNGSKGGKSGKKK